MKTWITRILLAFVWITLGFSMGRHSAPRIAAADDDPVDAGPALSNAGPVIVYAAHMTFRCPECNQIEWFTRELIESEFSEELADGRLVFRTVDYMRDTAFARKYNIASSTIVVTRSDDDEFQRLDEVWTKVGNKDDFFDYVRSAIQDSLATAAAHPAGTAGSTTGHDFIRYAVCRHSKSGIPACPGQATMDDRLQATGNINDLLYNNQRIALNPCKCAKDHA